jgi:hypothetical protein
MDAAAERLRVEEDNCFLRELPRRFPATGGEVASNGLNRIGLRRNVARTADRVDADGLRLRLPYSATKRDSARWVYLPEWLMEAIGVEDFQ